MFDRLTDEQCVYAIKSIFAAADGEKYTETGNPLFDSLVETWCDTVRSAQEKYLKAVENGKKGGRPSKGSGKNKEHETKEENQDENHTENQNKNPEKTPLLTTLKTEEKPKAETYIHKNMNVNSYSYEYELTNENGCCNGNGSPSPDGEPIEECYSAVFVFDEQTRRDYEAAIID